MKIIFEYVYKDMCDGEVRIQNDRRVEAETDGCAEIALPPCGKKVKVTVMRDTALLTFSNGREITVTEVNTPFEYEESYEFFGDVRYNELIGTVRLEK